jgi:hypothetical protein
MTAADRAPAFNQLSCSNSAGCSFEVTTSFLRDRLVKGEAIELRAVDFTPKPRVVTVKLAYQGIDRVPISGRTLRGEHFMVRPKIPAVVKLVVKIPDTHSWLTPPPSGFLGWQGPLVEPGRFVGSGLSMAANKKPEE